MWGFLSSSAGRKSACDPGDPRSIPGSGSSPGEGIGYPLQYSWASLVAQMVKNCLQCGRPGFDPWIGKIPWRRNRLSTPVFLGFSDGSGGKESACNAGDHPQRREQLLTPVELPGEFLGQRSLAGYSPQGCKESDMTEAT